MKEGHANAGKWWGNMTQELVASGRSLTHLVIPFLLRSYTWITGEPENP